MIFFAILCLILCVGSQSYVVGSPFTDYKYTLADAELRLHIVPANWSDAIQHCQLEGGVMASPISEVIARFMMVAMDDHKVGSSGVFIGTPNLVWDGKDSSDSSQELATGEPHYESGAEGCTALTGAGLLADVSCRRLLPYFCYKITQNSNDISKGETTEEPIRNLFDKNYDNYAKDDTISTQPALMDWSTSPQNMNDISKGDTTGEPISNPFVQNYYIYGKYDTISTQRALLARSTSTLTTNYIDEEGETEEPISNPFDKNYYYYANDDTISTHTTLNDWSAIQNTNDKNKEDTTDEPIRNPFGKNYNYYASDDTSPWFLARSTSTLSTNDINEEGKTDEPISNPFDKNYYYYANDDTTSTHKTLNDWSTSIQNTKDKSKEDATEEPIRNSIDKNYNYYASDDTSQWLLARSTSTLSTNDTNEEGKTEESIRSPFDSIYSWCGTVDTIPSSPVPSSNKDDTQNIESNKIKYTEKRNQLDSGFSEYYDYYTADSSSEEAKPEGNAENDYYGPINEGFSSEPVTPSIKVPQCHNKEYEWDSRTGSCYKFHRTPKIWLRALSTCFTEGGHLAVINSDVESTVLKDLFRKNPSYTMYSYGCNPNYASIGFRKWDDGEFATIYGKSLVASGFERWSPSEPNNLMGEDCGSIFRDGLLNDSSCKVAFPFICEMPAEINVV